MSVCSVKSRGSWWSALCLVACMGAIVALAGGAASAQAPERDPIKEIIDFIIERSPVLQVQQDVIAVAQRLSSVGDASDAGIPTFAQSQLYQAELGRLNTVIGALQTYAQLERDLVTTVIGRITEILATRNEIETQLELQRLLDEQLETTRRQVDAGLVGPEALWNLMAQIANARLTLSNAQDRLFLQKREMALNYGGDAWQDLLRLLDELEIR